MNARRILTALALALVIGTASCGGGERAPITIGVLSVCEGFFGFVGDLTYAGAELPLIRRGARLAGAKPTGGLQGASVAGREIRLVFGCGDDTEETALAEARRLVEDAGAEVLIGPVEQPEGFAVHAYARKRPGVTFVSGTAAGQSMTLRDPVPNFFSFTTDGAQFMAGLGAYAYRKLGWRRAVTIGNDVGFAYTETAGFVAEFCALGGTIVKRFWSDPEVAQKLSSYLARGFDGVFIGPDFAVLQKLPEKLSDRVVGDTFWQSVPKAFGVRHLGVVFASQHPQESSRQAWVDYVSDFRAAFPDLATGGYSSLWWSIAYSNAMEAMLRGLEEVDGDLSGGQRRFRAALAKVELDSPLGRIRLDRNRQAIGPSFLLQWQKDAKGKFVARTISVVPDVDQSFDGLFKPEDPPPSRTSPACKHGHPPRWARPSG